MKTTQIIYVSSPFMSSFLSMLIIFIAIGMKNNIVNTYLIDETEEQKAVNFQSFVRDKWDLWIGKFLKP